MHEATKWNCWMRTGKHLKRSRLIANGNTFSRVITTTGPRRSNSVTMSFWFPKGAKDHPGKFKKHWLGPFKVKYVLPINMVLLVDDHLFDPRPIFVNVNKLKPY